MSWTGFEIEGTYFDLSHLQSATVEVSVDGKDVKLHVSYGHHCFTDQKQNGRCLFKKDERYWCHSRYERSKELPSIIADELPNNYAIPHMTPNGESYHYMAVHDYAIFFTITKPVGTDNELKLRVISAYELDGWGRGTLPKGKPKKVRWILSERLQGRSILNRK